VRRARAQHKPSVRQQRTQKKQRNFPDRKKALLFVSSAVAAAVVIAFVIVFLWIRVPSLQAYEKAMLANYEEVRISLAHDDLASARRISAKMLEEFRDWAPVYSSVQLISNSDSLESAREAFATLSQEAIRLASRHGEYQILRCPPDCPEKCRNCRSNDFGSWIQVNPVVGNPFMGMASPHCGARIQ